MDSITLTPIGVVRNTAADTADEAWGKVISEIHLEDALAPGLQGLADWSHIVVIYYMHTAEFDAAQHLVRRPRDREDMPVSGIFAQRARHRPNRIGITAVPVLAVAGPVVRVRGLDAIDGTPVLDIKPYAPVYDGVSDPAVPAWFIRLMQGYF
ncbi:MAG: tRNA (N6-threonylcarbamoyladenosine(37)-N6)-methyltransferase TrmO [Anaerolineae bacterium]|jgi:tRNA-Thr(GGU) m(6)t(6)A37 methyltransferase TsaA|nr:tRNA (N6-threonylcarbamoyladenosine(37)-N6)-methyltransferase TrmO [Anaerolineae bacterium]